MILRFILIKIVHYREINGGRYCLTSPIKMQSQKVIFFKLSMNVLRLKYFSFPGRRVQDSCICKNMSDYSEISDSASENETDDETSYKNSDDDWSIEIFLYN